MKTRVSYDAPTLPVAAGGMPRDQIGSWSDGRWNDPWIGDQTDTVQGAMAALRRMRADMSLTSIELRPEHPISPESMELTRQIIEDRIKGGGSQSVNLREGGDIEVLGTVFHVVPHESVPRGTIVAVDPAKPKGDISAMTLLQIEDGQMRVVDLEQFRRAANIMAAAAQGALGAMGEFAKPWLEQVQSNARAVVEQAMAQTRAYGGQTFKGPGTTPWIMSAGAFDRLHSYSKPTLRGIEAKRWLRNKDLKRLRLCTQPQPIHSPWDRQSRQRRKLLAKMRHLDHRLGLRI